jgi:hypothetical protein
MREPPKRLHLCYGSLISAQDIGKVTTRGSKTGILLRTYYLCRSTFHLIKVATRWLASNAGSLGSKMQVLRNFAFIFFRTGIWHARQVEAQSGCSFVDTRAMPFHSGNAASHHGPGVNALPPSARQATNPVNNGR